MKNLIEKAKKELGNSDYSSSIEEKINNYSDIIKKLYSFSNYKSYKDIKISYSNSKLYIKFDFKHNVNIKFVEHIHVNNCADVFFEFLKYEDVKLERKAKNDSASEDLIKREFNNVSNSTIVYNLSINEVDIIINSDKNYEYVLEKDSNFEIY